MAKTFKLPAGEPLLDIVSYGRNGSRAKIQMTPGEVEHIRRTVRRVPEVMVKVLPRASNDLKAAGAHIDYISRKGHLQLETGDNMRFEHMNGKALMQEWDLDVDDIRRAPALSASSGRKPPKLIHKLMLSMPPGTPPAKVLDAARNFAREEFYGMHRYVLTLHTDEPHPHVHLVLKAVNEQGQRLNIRRDTLRRWRSEFARHLRKLGVEANATERAVRGKSGKALKDGIFRADLRGDSRFVRAKIVAAARQPYAQIANDSGIRQLTDTRRLVKEAWKEISKSLLLQGDPQLASQVQRFANELPPVLTDRELIAERLSSQQSRVREQLARMPG